MTKPQFFTRSCIALTACLVAPAVYADHNHGGGGGGHFAAPARGPAPSGNVAASSPRGAVQHPAPVQRAEPARPAVRVNPPPPVVHNMERPHVEAGEHWRGHESGAGDARYHVEHPWAAGHFRGAIGREHAYRVRRWDPGAHRFWMNGAFFGVAAWDLAYVHDWDWSDDQIILYDDPDHPGWYLAYNERTGNYVHVEYGGEGE